MSVVYLVLAIVFEVAATTNMKLADGFTRLTPSIAMVVFYVISFGFLTMTLKRLEVSFVYAVWSGAGTALVSVIGYYYFHESMSATKIASLALIIVGVIGLNLSGETH